jgi:transcriptional regulator with XRE-family HTH domain
MTLAAELGRILTQHREARGLSRKALADAHGLAANTLREVEMGQANPTLGRVEELARDVYEVTVAVVPVDGPVAAVAAHPVPRGQ